MGHFQPFYAIKKPWQFGPQARNDHSGRRTVHGVHHSVQGRILGTPQAGEGSSNRLLGIVMDRWLNMV